MVPTWCRLAAAALVTLPIKLLIAAVQVFSIALLRSAAARAKASVDPRPRSRTLLAMSPTTIKSDENVSSRIAALISQPILNLVFA